MTTETDITLASEQTVAIAAPLIGPNNLLENILAKKAGDARARKVFAIIAGAYDMRLGDAYPTLSKISEAYKLGVYRASRLRRA